MKLRLAAAIALSMGMSPAFALNILLSNDDGLTSNIKALVDALNKARPAAAKGVYLRKLAVSSTMGVGVRVDVNSITGA